MVKRGYAQTPLGQMHYVEQGSGPVLLLLHQTPRSHDEFRELIPLLADSYRVIAMDMYGFGDSAKFPAPHTIEKFADGAFALLDSLGISEFALYGHHTGGIVAIEMASRMPARVLALIASGTTFTDAEYRRVHAQGEGVDFAEIADNGTHLTRLWSIRHPFYPKNRPDLLNRFIRDALAEGVDPVEGHLACARYEMEKSIGKVTSPTLILGAQADPFSFSHVEPVRAALVSARSIDLVVIEGGMIPLVEQKSAEIAQAIRDFVGRVTEVVS
ncbi:MAG: alpha/beta hydrolase [Actinomycetes bacterium]|jgi:pimeloyl-ACP methyl ester carboxylesterase